MCIYKLCIHILVSISILDLGCFGVIVCVLGDILSNSQFFWPLNIAAPDGSRKARRAVPLALCSWAARLRRFAWKSGNSMDTLGHRAGLLPKSEMLLMIWGPFCHLSYVYQMFIHAIACLPHCYLIIFECSFHDEWSAHVDLGEKMQLPMVQIWPVEVKTPCGSMQTSTAHKADFAIGTCQN